MKLVCGLHSTSFFDPLLHLSPQASCGVWYEHGTAWLTQAQKVKGSCPFLSTLSLWNLSSSSPLPFSFLLPLFYPSLFLSLFIISSCSYITWDGSLGKFSFHAQGSELICWTLVEILHIGVQAWKAKTGGFLRLSGQWILPNWLPSDQ